MTRKSPSNKKPPVRTAAEFTDRYGDWMARDGACLIWTAATLASGYGVVRHDGSARVVHRVLYELTHGPLAPGLVVDHICYRRDCCEISHLRACTHKENMRHRAVLPSNNTSGARGVSWNRYWKKWEAHITVDDKKRYIGHFKTVDEAKAAVIAARARYFGEFAGVA